MGAGRAMRVGGSALVVLSTLLLVVYVYAGYDAGMMAFAEARESEFWSPLRLARRLGYIVIFSALFLLGVSLAARHKVVTLYLRRFRANTHVINPYKRGGLGGCVRLVTLQDKHFPSLSVRKREIGLLLLAPLTVAALLLLAINYDLPFPNSVNADYWMMGLLYTLYVLWLVIAATLFIVLHSIRLRLSSNISVAHLGQLKPLSFAIGTMSSWWRRAAILGSRSSVISVGDQHWKRTVRSLLRSADVVLIDITDESESLRWERRAARRMRVPVVLMAAQSPEHNGPGSQHSHPIIWYDPSDESSLPKFRELLANRLVSASRRRPLQCRPQLAEWRHALRVFVTYVGLLVLSAMIALAPIALGFEPVKRFLMFTAS